MMIRSETPADYQSIREIHIAAFANHPFSQQTEHRIVDALRADNALVVSLVAEVDGIVRGHIAFSSVMIDGETDAWFALGPVAVDPAYQGTGIGRRLIETGLAQLRDQGAHGCLLVGDPAYYERFGFRHNPALTFAGIPPEYLLCLPFGESTPSGEVSHHAAFSIQAET